MNAEIKPTAWPCELALEDGTTRRQFVEEDTDGLRWNDSGEPSPYRTTPLVTLAEANAMVAAERARLISELLKMNAQQNGRHNYYLYAAQRLSGKL